MTPSGSGYTLSVQGKVLQNPRMDGWGHIMFSDNTAEAGVYLFEETSTAGVYKICSTSGNINYVNVYTEHGVVGNDKAAKAGLATYTIEEVEAFPMTLPESNAAALCLPFNVVIPEGACAYDVTAAGIALNEEAGGYTCTMMPIAGSGDILRGGTPAIIKAEERTVMLPITMVDGDAKGPLPQSLLRGNYVAQALAQGSDAKRFVLTQQDGEVGFRAFDGTTDVAANQCWVECDMPEVSEFALSFGFSTGIYDTPTVGQERSSHIYNIAGQRLSKAQRGVNIIGNRKVVVD